MSSISASRVTRIGEQMCFRKSDVGKCVELGIIGEPKVVRDVDGVFSVAPLWASLIIVMTEQVVAVGCSQLRKLRMGMTAPLLFHSRILHL